MVAQSAATFPDHAFRYTSYSAGKAAKCYTANYPITISANTTELNLTELANVANQTVVTEIFQETQQINSTVAMRTIVGPSRITNRAFQIEGTFCFPVNRTVAQVNTVQVLTYGTGLDKSYWDIASGYSYVDAAAAAGYATFAYNRLGVGGSDYPDPIQIVQASTDVEVLHGIIQSLRSGMIGCRAFPDVIGIGHSYGSIIQLIENARYPEDVNATVLTSFIANLDNLGLTVFANNPAIASQNNPTRWGNLPNGYVVHDTAISIQLPFFRFPFFEQESVYSFTIFNVTKLTLLSSFSESGRRKRDLRHWPAAHPWGYLYPRLGIYSTSVHRHW